MLKFKDVPEEQRGEVVRLASEIFDQEHAERREHTSTVAAAEEMGIPEEYLERAAQSLSEKRIAEARQKRETRKRLMIGGGAVAAISIGALLLRPAPPVAPFSLSPAVVQPLLSANTGTDATATTENGAFVLKVNQFSKANDRYSANLDVPLPKMSLSGHQQIRFTVQGKGTIQKVRFFLEGGSINERWKGPDVAVSAAPRQVTVPLGQFIRQSRVGNTGWKDVAKGRPDAATTLSIKSGAPINPPSVTGTVSISEITFE